MANDLIHINNCETGEIIVREMTDEEQAEFDAANAESIAQLEKDKTLAEAAKTAAEAKLKALGLTSDDLKALGLG